jgi:hypothetical protein
MTPSILALRAGDGRLPAQPQRHRRDTHRRRAGAPAWRWSPKEDMDLIHARLQAAKQDFEAWRARQGAR